MKIEIANEQKKIKINKSEIRKTAETFLKRLRQKKDCTLNLVFVTKGQIRQANRRFFKKDKTTDVIAVESGLFKNKIFANYLGDIMICPQVAKENSKRFNTKLKNEIFLYIAHGILHLLHYNDLRKKERSAMRIKEKELLKTL